MARRKIRIGGTMYCGDVTDDSVDDGGVRRIDLMADKIVKDSGECEDLNPPRPLLALVYDQTEPCAC